MARPARFSVEVADGMTTVALLGELDLSCRDDMEAVTESLSHDGLGLVVFDLGGLSFMDSTGLLALFHAKRALNDEGRMVQVVGAHGSVLKVIELTKMAQELNLSP